MSMRRMRRVPERGLASAIGEARIYVLHNRTELNPARLECGRGLVQAVISGHSHKPPAAAAMAVLFVNPGSSGPRRFKLRLASGG